MNAPAYGVGSHGGSGSFRALALLSLTLTILLADPRFTAAREVIVTVTVRVTSEGNAVMDAQIVSGAARGHTDASGRASLSLPLGSQTVIVHKMGFAPDTLHVIVRAEPQEIAVELKEAPVRMAEVIVAATRSERRVADEPTRVEVTDRDDVEEQLAASPGNVAELLTEASGVRVQNTSPGLGSANVRVRGLPGRYTKILSDGLPLFGLTSEGLGPLQIPPADLERVEVIKGVASALYGPTALGGVVNLVSQAPGGRREVLLNQTSRDGSDALFWDSRRVNARWGYTLLASADRQSRKDLDGDGWADLPGFRRAVLRPRWLWTGSEGDSWLVTSGLTVEDREGGTVAGALLPNGESFREDLDTRRADMGTVARLRLDRGRLLSLRGSLTKEWRTHHFRDVRERDRRSTLFGEVALTVTRASQVIVAGVAAERDAYHALDVSRMDYAFLTPGLFAEHIWSPLRWFSLSSSARMDFHSAYGNYLSPRISALLRVAHGWTARVGGGTGIFAPTPFTEETEVIGLSRLRPIAGVGIERAQSVSADVGGTLGSVEVNASAFRSSIGHPVALRPVPGDSTELELANAVEPTRVDGVELFARFKHEPMSVTWSYAFLYGTEFDIERAIRRTAPFNPRHSGGLTVVWEEEETGTRAGVEVYYTGRQALVDDPYRSLSTSFAFVDVLLERRLGPVAVFLHGENLNDVRQTRFDPLLRRSPDPEGRWTTDVWAPLEGRSINAGVRWRY